MRLTLTIRLLSDTTFGRGDGVAGLVDEEIEYDPATGLPIIRGRTLKGLLVEECANILYALSRSPGAPDFGEAAEWLFGRGGSTLAEGAYMRVGRGELPHDLQAQIRKEIQANGYAVSDILNSLTAIRRQTAVEEETGAPENRSLRASRVALRGLTFRAPLDFDRQPQGAQLALLAACAASVRRAGSGRNRGRGRIEVRIEGPNFDFDAHLKRFAALVTEARGRA